MSHIGERPQVVLTITSAHCYFVVFGSADVSRDPELIRRLWRPSYRAWFPEGKDDRDATVLRVVVTKVNYWEPPRSQFVRVFQAVKAVITRRVVETPMKPICVCERAGPADFCNRLEVEISAPRAETGPYWPEKLCNKKRKRQSLGVGGGGVGVSAKLFAPELFLVQPC